jgi:hypothetical protein
MIIRKYDFYALIFWSMFTTDETCKITGIYRYCGHSPSIDGCHKKWEEVDIRVEKGKKFPPVGSCKTPAQWIYIRPS